MLSASLAFAVEPDARALRFGWQEQPTTTFAIGRAGAADRRREPEAQA